MLYILKTDTSGVSEALNNFKEKYKLNLPKKYKEFLLKYNGGETLDTSFRLNRESSSLRLFYGLSNVEYYCNFQYLIDNKFLQEFLSQGYLPIASDSFGNTIVLGVVESNFNQIAFYDHERQKSKPLNVSFEEFIQKLKSKKKKIRTIEERIEGVQSFDAPIEVDDELISFWQEEIDKYGNREQIKVEL